MPHFDESKTAPERNVVRSPDQHDRVERIRVKNRRKRYLDLHPEYFAGANLELADPLLYDRMVRRFQSAEEREREGRERGYSGMLEADLVRSEAKMEALRHPDPNSPLVYARTPDGSISGVERNGEDRVQSREEGWERWKDVMRQRFMRGDDGEFDYRLVDDSDEYDDREEEDRRRLEAYLDAEEAAFLGNGKPEGETGAQDF